MNITLKYTTLYATVERSLSVIGKRSTDDDGNRLFTDITLGTREQGIITDYFRQAVIDLSAELSGLITSGDAEGVTFALALPDNHSAAVEPFIQQSCEEYCVSFALYSWFTVTAPRIAEKYLGDCRRQLSAVIRLAFDKRPPASAAGSPLDINTSVSQNQ